MNGTLELNLVLLIFQTQERNLATKVPLPSKIRYLGEKYVVALEEKKAARTILLELLFVSSLPRDVG